MWGVLGSGALRDGGETGESGPQAGATAEHRISGPLEGRIALGGGETKGSVATGPPAGLFVAMIGEAWPLNAQGSHGAALVAELYRLHREDFVNHCDGQFAVVIVDERESQVLLTVNWPGGAYPLYYALRGDRLAFGTRASLLFEHCGCRIEADEQALINLFRFGGLASQSTLFQGVCRVLPGFALTWWPGRAPRHRPVYRLPEGRAGTSDDDRDLLPLLRQAIARRTAGPGRVGAFLSGGADSSLSVALMAEASSEPVETFTLSFGQSEFDESRPARLVAERFGTNHHVFRLDSPECLERLPEIVWALEEPITDYSVIPSFFLAEATREHVEAVLASDGPDHLLGRRFGPAACAQALKCLPGGPALARWATRTSNGSRSLRARAWRRLRRKHAGRQLWLALASSNGPGGYGLLNIFASVLWGPLPVCAISDLFSEDLRRRTTIPQSHLDHVLPLPSPRASSLNDFAWADAALAGLCGVFAKSGRMSTDRGLIIREPYLATPVIRCMRQLADSHKVQGSLFKRLTNSVPTRDTKLVLRRLLVGRVPTGLTDRPKQGFEPPLAEWLRDCPVARDADRAFGSLIEHTDWFNVPYLRRLVAEHCSGQRDHRYMMFLLACLDQWHRIYLRGRGRRPTWTWSSA